MMNIIFLNYINNYIGIEIGGHDIYKINEENKMPDALEQINEEKLL